MKKILILFLPVFVSVYQLAAQHVIAKFDQDEFGQKLVASNLYLEPDRSLCELNESINVAVHIIAASEKNLVPVIFNYDFRDPFDAPWKIGEFRIVSGGAKIGATEGCTAQIIMPATMPEEKAVVVQVTLNPVTKDYQQVQLFATIYLEDNDNVFTFNCTYLGIHAEKYLIKNNGGAFTKANAAAGSTAVAQSQAAQKRALEYAIKSTSADITAAERGFDLSALTGNAKAVYNKENNVTGIYLNDDHVEMVAGKISNSRRMYMIAISFPGNAAGSFTIKTKPTITASISLPAMGFGYACNCSDDPEYRQRSGDPDPPCLGGTINITRYDLKNKMVEGFVNVHMQSADPANGTTFFSTLSGKFKVPLAN